MFRPLIIIACHIITSPLMAQQATIKQCQRYIDQAASYEVKRRNGGSAQKMDEWKFKQREYEQQFFSGNCKKHRRQLLRK